MHLEYITKKKRIVSFEAFTSSKMDRSIGTAEGILGSKNDMVTVIKISDEFKNQGYGYRLFSLVFNHISTNNTVTSVIGTWSRDYEFSYCENGQSTNLTVFRELKAKGFPDAEAALNTPTGKWVRKLGFKKVQFHHMSEDHMTVEFTKD